MDMPLKSQIHVDINIKLRNQVLLLELCLINIILHCHYYTTSLIIYLHGHFTILPICLYWNDIYHGLQTTTMIYSLV